MNRFAKRREALQLSQVQLAELLGISRQTIMRIELQQRPAPPWFVLALEAIEARAAAGTLKVREARPPGRPRRPIAELLD